jgi:hypothetical protein
MKIKIDNEGCLWIERAGKMKAQICPYDENWTGCGDWCPLFDDSDITDPQEGLGLCLCHNNFPNATVIDERGGE